MITITDHGGAVRFWNNPVTGARAVLCRDGTLLVCQRGDVYWRVEPDSEEALKRLDPAWRWDDSTMARHLIERTADWRR